MESHRSYGGTSVVGTVASEVDEEPLFLPSFAQERLWFMDQLEPESSAYNLRLLLRLKGTLNIAALWRSLQTIVERHEVLRTTFVPVDGRPMQAIAPYLEVALPLVDLSQLIEGSRSHEIRRLIAEGVALPFDLHYGPLVRAQLLRLAPTEHILIVTFHHIVADGWSGEILLQELNTLYNAYVAGQPPTLPELPVQYADYAVWQREWLQGEVLEKQLGYWRQQLADAPPLLELPTDHPRPAVQTFKGNRYILELPPSLVEALRALSAREGVTLFMTLLAAFQTLLMRYSGQADIVVGTPVAGRTRLEVKPLIGLFANTLVLRTDLSGNPTFRALLRRVREVCLDAYEYQDLPFEKLVEVLQPQRSLSYSPLFQVLFGHANFSSHSPEFAGLTLIPMQIEHETARYDLVCDFLEDGHELSCRFEYNTDLFEADTIARLAAHLQTLLESIVAQPEQRLWELNLLSPEEEERLLHAWNQPLLPQAEQQCLPERFAAQAAQTPDAVALAFEDQQLTYAELDARATQLAQRLQRLGVRPERLVGVCLERSAEMVIALLGILKAGGAYVPLDPAYPAERLAFMAQDARLSVLLTQHSLLERLPPGDWPLLYLDTEWEQMAQAAPAAPSRAIAGSNLAYVLYTSGSTGTPKGVQISHAALLNFLTSMQRQLEFSRQEVLLAVTSLSFDIAGLELYLPLLTGARLEIASREISQDGALLATLLSERGASCMQATPATWRMLLAAGWQPGADFGVLCGGEGLSGALAVALRTGGAQTWNLYGPTETTIWSSALRVDSWQAIEGLVPLGQPIAQTQFYVLDAWGHLVPTGVPGELYIGGAGLARGYLGRPDLTAERFVPDPFSDQPGTRLYRTGDRVRYRADGSLEYMGRSDFQVKLRGYRIELGEIESVLEQQPGVAQAVVVLREMAPGDHRLVAYIVPEAGQEAPTSSAMRQELQAHLPEYMLPAAYVLLDHLPLTPNGKLDRHALPAPERTAQSETSYVAPRTPTEKTLTDIWAEVLKLERVGIDDNFFALGGHSLLGVQLMQRISEAFHITLPMRTLFEAPTISELALAVEQKQGKQGEEESTALILPRIVSDLAHRFQPFPLTDVQQAYWIGRNAAFELGNVATHTYSEWESSDLDLERYTRAWQLLINRHEMLRAIVQPDGQQRILADVPPFEIATQDLRGLSPEIVAARLDAVREQMSHQVLPTDRWPLFEIRASLLDGGRIRIHRSADLLMVDAWSWQILGRELNQLYLDPDLEMPPLALSFRDYVLTEYALRKKELYRRARDYWWKRLPDLPPAPELPLAQNPAALTQPHFTRRSHHLEPAVWSQIKQAATSKGLTPSGVLLAAFAEVLGMWSKNPRFTLNLTLFNRLPLHPQVNDIVGDFTSLTLLAADHSTSDTFTDRAKRLQQQLWEDLEHRHVSGIAVLRELARIHGNTARARMPVVFTSALNLQGSATDAAQEQEPGWRAEHVYGITQTSQVWLDHQVREDEGVLLYSWDAVEDLFPAGLLDDMFSAYNQLLERLATEGQWEAITAASLLPPAQLELRAAMNATEAPISTELLHTLFVSQVAQRPQQQAVVTPQRVLSYQEVDTRARQIGRLLRDRGAHPNQLVAVVMEKGWEQVVGVLGILYAGAAYLPIDPDLPPERLRYLLKHGEAHIALCQSWLNEQIVWPDDIHRIVVDELDPGDPAPAAPEQPIQRPEDLAYVIFTSGSTGLPKGVMIDHRGAVNTVLDINDRFGVGPQDRILALSALNFDLSVYDIFGILGAGGTIVLPAAEARRDPAHWIHLLEQERVTIWNSVPALMDLAVTHLSSTHQQPPQELRLVMMSGDWIPLNLPDQIRSLWKHTQIVSLGGATEASIWSILFPIENIEPGWKSIPYGHPMRNQRFHVLNARLEPSPTWVPGELYIGGIGLAQGYWRDEMKTAASFFIHPRTGERLYRTGDLGRYLPTGEIEFLGREDFQVKIRGYRIELGEIEAVLSQQPGVGQVVVIVREDTPGDKRLVAYVVPAPGASLPSPEALRQAAQAHLPDYMVPAAILLLETVPLTPNGKVDRRALPAPDWAAAKGQETTAEPRTAVEQKVADLWKQVLGVEQVGIHDNFFELGGHSVLAVQLLARIFESFQINIPLRTLFEEPTIAELSKHLVQEPASSAAKRPQKSVPEERERKQNRSFGRLDNPEERARFKERQLGIRRDQPRSQSIHLFSPEVDEATRRLYAQRHSARKFGSEPVSFEQFSGLLGCLRQIALDGKPKYRWGSAGGLYPVQVYLHIKPERVDGISAGTYYYHPVDHRLAAITPNAHIGPEAHAWINQLLYEQAAFSIFLIGQLSAIEPLYGDSSRDFCLIEAGLISQLLETTAPDQRIGLCQVGNVNFKQVQHLFGLENGYLYLHALLGGTPAADQYTSAQPTPAEEEWEEGQI
jgi:amino acid adenylation domain-containing protein